MNLEYGHIYIEDMLEVNWKEKTAKKIELERELFNNFKGAKIVLIDDKSYSLNKQEKDFYKNEVKELYTKLGVKPDQIYFEKFYEEVSKILYDSIDDTHKHSVFFRKEEKHVDFIRIKDKSISVRERKNGVIKNYCVMLSTAWSIYKEEQYGSNHIVLPEYYKKVESNVSLLLNLLEKPNNNTYFYY